MYTVIIVKLLVGMVCVLFFLRLAGKAQMSQMSPIDTVNSFVVGAIVGGIIYSPTLTIWDMLFAIFIWILITILIRYLSRFVFFNDLIHGKPEFIIKDGVIDLKVLERNNMQIDQLMGKLREKDVFTLLDVDNICFEIDGQISVSKKKDVPISYLLVSNGILIEESLEHAKKDESWLKSELQKLGYSGIEELYGVEWTPNRGFYIIEKDGRTHNFEDRKRSEGN